MVLVVVVVGGGGGGVEVVKEVVVKTAVASILIAVVINFWNSMYSPYLGKYIEVFLIHECFSESKKTQI